MAAKPTLCGRTQNGGFGGLIAESCRSLGMNSGIGCALIAPVSNVINLNVRRRSSWASQLKPIT